MFSTERENVRRWYEWCSTQWKACRKCWISSLWTSSRTEPLDIVRVMLQDCGSFDIRVFPSPAVLGWLFRVDGGGKKLCEQNNSLLDSDSEEETHDHLLHGKIVPLWKSRRRLSTRARRWKVLLKIRRVRWTNRYIFSPRCLFYAFLNVVSHTRQGKLRCVNILFCWFDSWLS